MIQEIFVSKPRQDINLPAVAAFLVEAKSKNDHRVLEISAHVKDPLPVVKIVPQPSATVRLIACV